MSDEVNAVRSENNEIIIVREVGRQKVSFLSSKEGGSYIDLPNAVWNYGAIVNALIRQKYSESDVEAIVSNSLMLLSGASTVSDDEATEKQTEMSDFQTYRDTCKARAKELMSLGEDMGLTEMYG
jgi:hypothetical protein